MTLTTIRTLITGAVAAAAIVVTAIPERSPR